MTVNIYCYNYNNYYNRIIKKEETIQDYGAYIYAELDVNFNYADGVNTKQVINTDLEPDYVILTDDNGNIDSRWFVIDADYKLNGQHVFTLHRDTIADNYDAVCNAPVFIEKATLEDNDPGIFNKEDMTFNQIKTNETELKDETGCAWIVGYVARNYGDGDHPAEEITFQGQAVNDYTASSIADFQSNQFDNALDKTYYKYLTDREFVLNFLQTSDQNEKQFKFIYNFNTGWRIENNPQEYNYTENVIRISVITSKINDLFNRIKNNLSTASIVSNESTFIDDITYYSDTKYNTIKNNRGKILKLETSPEEYYKINVEPIHIDASTRYSVSSGEVYQAVVSTLTASGYAYTIVDTYAGAKSMFYQRTYNDVRYTLDQFRLGSYSIDFGEYGNNRLRLKDAPYDMFCMPYGRVNLINTKVAGFGTKELDKITSLSWAQGIAQGLGSNLYDLQLVPYCPITGIICSQDLDGTPIIDLNSQRANGRYDEILSEGNVVGVVIWSTSSSGTKNIPVNISSTEPKIENECDIWRLVSPNYNGQFEFSVAKNGGISNFNVDYTYLPYNPYIHVNPTFSGLYGQDFNDARGLICGGDFSIAYLSDNWVQYQINNKNYQNSFDRQIQHMEVNNKYQRINDIINASVGTVQGGLTGATAGGMIAPGVGTAIGAGVGAVLSAGGGVGDAIIGEKMRSEAMDYTKDQFGYQLGNIQALPYGLAKNTAYNENNKIFPILEYYTCTDVEKEALRDKLRYNGMTVMRIGRINDFIRTEPSYIKGRLIRLEDVDNDFHMVNSIADELNKGVFI